VEDESSVVLSDSFVLLGLVRSLGPLFLLDLEEEEDGDGGSFEQQEFRLLLNFNSFRMVRAFRLPALNSMRNPSATSRVMSSVESAL